jgi:Flp pilus assembly protein TadG
VIRARDHGQSTVELAVVMPVIVVLLLVIIQVALVIRDQVLVVHAAREAARSAAVATIDERSEAARSAATGAGPLDPERLRIADTVTPGDRRVHVRVEYSSRTDLPLVGTLLPDVDLSSDATMRLESDR